MKGTLGNLKWSARNERNIGYFELKSKNLKESWLIWIEEQETKGTLVNLIWRARTWKKIG